MSLPVQWNGALIKFKGQGHQ